MSIINILFIIFIIQLFSLNLSYSAPVFTFGPAVTSSDVQVEISFTVNESTDVTVEIQNDSGRAVRHLGSGVLGSNAPAPFTQNSLSQTVIWNWIDDNGVAIDKKLGYRIKVNLGLVIEFNSIIGWTGQGLGIIQGMTVDTAGNLYILSKIHPTNYRTYIYGKVFDSNGNYLRSFLPFGTDISRQLNQGVKYAYDIDSGDSIPMMLSPFHHIFLKDFCIRDHQPIITRDNKLLFPIGPASNNNPPDGHGMLGMYEGTFLAEMGTDGSASNDYTKNRIAYPEPGYVQKVLSRAYLAESPNGEYVYISGIKEGHSPAFEMLETGERGYNAILRVSRSNMDDGEVYLGEKYVSGSDQTHFNNPLGIDVDDSGYLYIADRDNNRIMIFDSLGNYYNFLPITDPVFVKVHQNGKIYVFTRIDAVSGYPFYPIAAGIARLGGKDDATQEAVINFEVPYKSLSVFALDKRSFPVRMYLGGLEDAATGLLSEKTGIMKKFEDNGTSITDLGDVIAAKNPDPGIGRYHKYIDVDPETDEVWWDNKRFDGNSGQFLGTFETTKQYNPEVTTLGHGAFNLGPNSSVVYRNDNGSGLRRYYRDGKPYPFSAYGTHELQNAFNFPSHYASTTRGIDVLGNGDIYLIHHVDTAVNKADHEHNLISIIGEDGTLKDSAIVNIHTALAGLAIAKDGSIFAGAHLRPYGQALPDVFQNFYDNIYTDEEARTALKGHTGSLVSLSRGATLVENPTGTDYESQFCTGYNAAGINWLHQTASCQPSHKCFCESADQDIDAHNRIFSPDPYTYSVWVYDRNGNKITRFGGYGNMDSRGAGSANPNPAIPFLTPARLAVSHKAVYVNDYYANRVVRADFTYAVSSEAVVGTVGFVNSSKSIISDKPALDFANPFPVNGRINFTLSKSDRAILKLYNLQGRVVRSFSLAKSGDKQVYFNWDKKMSNGSKVPAGLYCMHLIPDRGILATKKMVLID
ncbi:MAG: hypothetical protein ABIA63_10735 [bacterium]